MRMHITEAEIRHLLNRDDVVAVEIDPTPLPGGVSSDVVAVRVDGTDLVVKRALDRLRVEADWRASPARASTEAAALRWAGDVLPDRVPRLVAVDPERHLLAETRAPRDRVDWKSELLATGPRPGVAAVLGDALATWHVASVDADLAAFADRSVFEDLRVAPFYEWVADRHPAVAAVIMAQAERMRATRDTLGVLVHGDFSPKNVLVGPSGLWVIDWEVAHVGDPVFDIAFLVTHLLCKSIARPAFADALREAALEFVGRYEAGTRDRLGVLDQRDLAAHVACLLLARVDGKSPVEYFTPPDRDRARRVALAALGAGPSRVDDLWEIA
jgi:aminoglycoside phosphotransferase (APT) family kinase protein